MTAAAAKRVPDGAAGDNGIAADGGVLNVSCVQHFSTGDGPGIRTTVFLKGCNLRCPWCHNPENISPRPQTLEYPQADKRVSYGRMRDVGDVAAEVLEDLEFYGLNDGTPAAQRGGLTLSGGEPLLQSGAAAALVRTLEAQGVPAVIDTAGCVRWQCFEPFLGHVQAFYFDYKTGDEQLCRELLGGDLSLIRDNLRKLIAAGEPVRVRIPLIPGVNTGDAAIGEMCAQLTAVGAGSVDLLPFHRLGSGKYAALGIDYAYKNTPPPGADVVDAARKKYGQYFDCRVE